MMSLKLINIALLNITGSHCLCIIGLVSKTEAISLMKKADLTKSSEAL